jgi:glycosyltransferase involved in cell wall biosynthesis
VNGFLVSDQNPKEMAHRVRLLLTNPKMRRDFGQAGRKISLEKFSMERMVQHYQALFNMDFDDKPKR